MNGELDRRLKLDDIETRLDAVSVLRQYKDDRKAPEFARLLIKAMQDQSWRVRKAAVDILLNNYQMDSYIEEAIKLLYIDDNAGARNSAVEILTKLGTRATLHLIEGFNTTNSDVRKFIIDIIGDIKDKRSLPMLISALNDDDENVKASAVEHLGSMREPSVVDALLNILKGDDLWTAYPSVEALGKIGDRKAVATLLDVLKSPTLREPAVRALGWIGDDAALDSIVQCIDDRSKSVQQEAVLALERLYHSGVSEEKIAGALRGCYKDRAADVLIEQTKSVRIEVKTSAVLLLGLLKDDRALSELISISEDSELFDDVKKAVIYIGKDNPSSLVKYFSEADSVALRFVCEAAEAIASPLYTDLLSGLIDHEDGHIRAISAHALSRIGDPKSVDLIKGLLLDPYPDVQEAAIISLGRLKHSIHLEEVINAFSSENPVLRKNIALLLGNLGTNEAVSALEFALKDEDSDVRAAVVDAFAKIGNEASVENLMLALTDEQPYIRSSAAGALGKIGGPEVADSLILLLTDESDMVRVSAIKSLGVLKVDRAIPMLTALMSDQNGLVVTSCMEALGNIGGEAAKNALSDMLHSRDSEFRRTAIKSLTAFEDSESLIVPFLGNSDWATRAAAVEALHSKKSEYVRHAIESLYDGEDDPVVKKTAEKYLNA